MNSLPFIFFAVAAMCNAAMDSTENLVAYNKSIFSKYCPKYWCKEVSWAVVKFIPFTKYRADFWHIMKSFMVIFIAMTVVSYKPIIHFNMPFWVAVIHLIILGIVWILSFNLFYNKIFRRKDVAAN